MRTPGAYPLRVLRGLVPGRNKLSSHISTLSLFLSPSLPPSSLLLNHPVHTTTTTQRHSNGHSNFSPARLLSLSHILPSSLSLSCSLSSPSASYGAPFSPGTRGFTHLSRPAAPFPFARRGRRTKGTKESDALSVYPTPRRRMLPPFLFLLLRLVLVASLTLSLSLSFSFTRAATLVFAALAEGTTPIGAGGQHFCP